MNIGIACDEGQAPAEVIDFLEAAGLPAGPLRSISGPAIVPAGPAAGASADIASDAGITWLLASGADVLAGCAGGALDAGVVGKDLVLELRPDAHELLDLRVCADSLVYATPAARPAGAGRARPRVATRYPRVTRRHFSAQGLQVVALQFTAAALAPALGMAEGVVELRSRLAGAGSAGEGLGGGLGGGLGEALEVREEVAACSARLLAGRAARTLRAEELARLVARLRALLEES